MRSYTIYWNPSDYPERYVLREFTIGGGSPEPIPGEVLAIATTIKEVRDAVPDGTLCRWPRLPADDPCIVETWM